MAEPIAGYVLPQQFIRLTWLSVGACPVFVAVTECEIRVRTHRRTVLINANFWLRVQHHVRIVQQLLPVPFRSVPGFILSRLITSKFQCEARYSEHLE